MKLKECNQNTYPNVYYNYLKLPYDVMKKTFVMVS